MIAALVLLGCAARVATVAPNLAPPPPAEPPAPAEPAPTEEELLFTRIAVAYASGNTPTALASLAEFESRFAQSRALGVLADWRSALERMGKPSPSMASVVWPAGFSLPSTPTLVVFFEPWCGHCKEDVPQVELHRREYAARGLSVVGVTTMSRGATEDDLAAFLAAGEVGFPIGRDDGTTSENFGLAGVPHLAFLHEGTLLWSGHPSLVTLDLVTAITEGRPLPIAVP
jgi:thiol-disulfide isomerase/thioredoxin